MVNLPDGLTQPYEGQSVRPNCSRDRDAAARRQNADSALSPLDRLSDWSAAFASWSSALPRSCSCLSAAAWAAAGAVYSARAARRWWWWWRRRLTRDRSLRSRPRTLSRQRRQRPHADLGARRHGRPGAADLPRPDDHARRLELWRRRPWFAELLSARVRSDGARRLDGDGRCGGSTGGAEQCG